MKIIREEKQETSWKDFVKSNAIKRGRISRLVIEIEKLFLLNETKKQDIVFNGAKILFDNFSYQPSGDAVVTIEGSNFRIRERHSMAYISFQLE